MIAVVDIGNARIKWARAHSGALSDHGMVPHLDDPDRAVDAFAHAFPEAVGRVVATNVAGEEMATRLSNVTRERWDLQPEWIETSASQL
ncbi:MAG TPA: type III pantothenate kinase, partial [Gammaproteobacteria bacterium]|nr:type III pantothenate kinase [Gammaproteobacteria bacterium]